MLKENYRREMDRVSLPEDRLEEMIEAMKQKEETPVKTVRKTWKTALAVAAACAALVVSAFAASPALRQALADALGGFAPYAQTQESVVTDQGIQVSVMKTVADESGGTAYLEIKDLTGDRLTEDTRFRPGGVFPIAYDPESRTLLAQCKWTREFMESHGDGAFSVTIPINEIWGGQAFEGIALPRELLSPDNVLKTQIAPDETSCGTADDRVVLVPEQTPRTLEGTDKFTLSSMGFDEQGRLHVQIKLADAYIHQVSENDYFLDLAALNSYLKETCDYDFYANGRTHPLENGRYLDMVYLPYFADFKQGKATGCLPKELLQNAPVALSGWLGEKERTQGEWTLTIPLELTPARSISIGQTVSTKYIESADLSVMSVTLRLSDRETEIRGSFPHIPITVYLADGTHVTVQRGRNIHWWEENEPYYLDTWSYPEPIDPAQVVGISLGYWYIPLDGATAQSGYWLAQLP